MSKKPIEDKDFGVVYEALAKKQIGLEEVRSRFVDFKTAYCKGDKTGHIQPSRNNGKPLKQAKIEKYLFLSKEEPERYITRWLDYKTKAKACKNYDCDGARSAWIVPNAINVLYDSLWGEKSSRMAKSGDTMNSLWITYAQILKSERKADTKVMKQLNLLAYLTHTIGNFIPCCGNFNNGRTGSSQDYWDITLIRLQGFYLNDDHLDSFNPNCIAWLKSFGESENGWKNLIEDNYLESYVDEEYQVRRFYTGHEIGSILPEDNQILECLLSMNAAIIARGNEMREVLENRLEEEQLRLFFKDV